MKTKSRLVPVDVARGLAILTVVLGHQGIQTANRLTFSFNLTVFFLISGFFLSTKDSLRHFIKKKARSLLVPYVFTALVIIVLSFLITGIKSGWPAGLHEAGMWLYAALYGSGVDYDWYFFYIKGIGALWFLLAMFWALLFVRISLYMDYRWRIVFFAVLFWFGYYTRWQLWLPFSIQAGACDALFVYFGYLCKDLTGVYQKLSNEFKVTLWAVCFVLWLTFVRDFEAFGVVNNTFNRGFIDFVISALSCLLIFELSGFIARHFAWITKWLVFLGRYTIVILCLHIVELSLFNFNDLFAFPVLISLRSSIYLGIVWVIKILFFALATKILIQIPFIRKVFSLH